jgi:Zn-dependent peptidase ImmA (M78 family)
MSAYIDVETLANAVLERSGSPRLENGVAIDVESILREYRGFDVAEIEGLVLRGQPLLGAFVPAYALVMVEANCLSTRKRFSMAHELGHAEIEHPSAGQSERLFAQVDEAIYFRCDATAILNDQQPAQRQRSLPGVLANKFAAALLMPARLVLDIWKSRQDVEYCAELLNVSLAAMSFRIAVLLPPDVTPKSIPRLI